MSQNYLTAFFDRQRQKEWEAAAFGVVLLGCLTAVLIAVFLIPLPCQLNFAGGPLLGAAAELAHGSPCLPVYLRRSLHHQSLRTGSVFYDCNAREDIRCRVLSSQSSDYGVSNCLRGNDTPSDPPVRRLRVC
jgi:hypothetical protein